MELTDRVPDFCRRRHTRCASCGHEDAFDDDWFDRWGRGHETCPRCGADCEQEHATRVAPDPCDPALDDGVVPTLSWWHTSTHADWPSASYEPPASVVESLRQHLGDLGADRWARRQKTKALHVGTYEAAIHNMLRRCSDQSDRDKQFYLYRVRLRPDLVVAPGCGEEIVNFVGDVQLDDACPAGIDATRYVNRHEDPGGVSLALGLDAIHSVQSVAIPLPMALEDDGEPAWVRPAIAELTTASVEPIVVVEPDNRLTRLRRQFNPVPPTTSRRRQVQQRIRDRVLDDLPRDLPWDLRDGIRDWVPVDDAISPQEWCEQLVGITQLISDPRTVIQAAARAEHRPLTVS